MSDIVSEWLSKKASKPDEKFNQGEIKKVYFALPIILPYLISKFREKNWQKEWMMTQKWPVMNAENSWDNLFR